MVIVVVKANFNQEFGMQQGLAGILFCLWATLAGVQASAQVATLADDTFARAMQAVRLENWQGAADLAARKGGVAPDIVEWHRLRDGQGTAAEVETFLERRADWPGLKLLRKRSEGAFADVGSDRILRFFETQGPQTAQGVLIYAKALEGADQNGSAEAEVVLAWRTMALSAAEHRQFIDRYGALLADHHIARLDALLWKGWNKNSALMTGLVPDGWNRLAAARLGLRAQTEGVDGLIAAVPAELAEDPGLAFERMQWRARKGRNDSAIELMLAHSRAGTLGEARYWAGWRASLARSEMRAGRYQVAYDLASTHGLLEGSKFADLEWLSGYLALRFLDRPEDALHHFVRFEISVETPISLGRAGYWIGRTLATLGEPQEALASYRAGGVHQTTFYGLLAAEMADMPVDPSLKGDEEFPDWRGADFTGSSVHKAALMFLQVNEISLAERFWVHLSETQDRTALGQMGDMAQDLNAPHVAVMLGKKMVRGGPTLPGPYYPLHPLVERDLPVSTEMALAIARRESEFDPVVISGAGARGLMQLMPETARLVASRLDLPYSKSRLITDPEYNATLGSQYLAGLAEEFDGNVIMVAAGYNAGPGRPRRWMEDRGDPRADGMDIIDWIEHIPFNETRNYVMRVSESLPVYRARLGKDPLPIPFSQELTGSSVFGFN